MKKILIADDDDDFRNLLFMALAEGFDVTLAADGIRALARAAEERPDLILMDVMIPDISGLELMRALAAGEETRDIPVIVITGGDSDASMWRLIRQERNFADFIAKTAPLDLIVERVQELAAKE